MLLDGLPVNVCYTLSGQQIERSSMSIIEHEPQVQEAPAQLDEMGKAFLEAADIIRKHGLWQAKTPRYIDTPQRCIMLAIGEVMDIGVHPGKYPTWFAVCERLGFRYYNEATAWNDTKGRTKEQVIERLERAAYNL
jgi:hypothetical protein